MIRNIFGEELTFVILRLSNKLQVGGAFQNSQEHPKNGKMSFDQVERLSKRALEQGKEVLFSQLCITFLFLFSLSQNSSYHYSNLRSRTNTKIRSYIDKNMFQVDEELKGRLAAVTRGFEVHPYLD